MSNSNSNSNSNSHSNSHPTTYAPSTYSTYSTSTTYTTTDKPVMPATTTSNRTSKRSKAWSKTKTFVDSFKIGGPSVEEIEAERRAKEAGMSKEERMQRFGMVPNEDHRAGSYSGKVWT